MTKTNSSIKFTRYLGSDFEILIFQQIIKKKNNSACTLSQAYKQFGCGYNKKSFVTFCDFLRNEFDTSKFVIFSNFEFLFLK